MGIIKTLIVDDSAFVRKAIRGMLSTSPQIQVVGMARNGADALPMVEQFDPDVVTCDLLMPVLDGVGFVRQQMQRKPVPILLLSASPEDAGHVLEALESGAVDFIRKPTALANNGLLAVRDELIEKVKAAALSSRSPRSLVRPGGVPSFRPATHVDIVVLGISTGGPQALRYLVPQFPDDFPVPLVIVLHMPIGYTAPFADKLDEISRLSVREAFEGCVVRPGEALLAPAGRHVTFKRTSEGSVVVHLSIHPADKPHRPSIDVLFRSAAETYHQRVLGVVMTGMGDDGKEGAGWIKAQGGTILTQSEASCVIYGMPRCVVEVGLSDGEVSLSSMAEEIGKRL
jgi:two-component system chemotaxis response regulator CheB